jgi:hypothetical protein
MSKDEDIRKGLPNLATAPSGADGAAAVGAQTSALPGAASMTTPSKRAQWPPWAVSALAVFAVIAPVTVMGLLLSIERGTEEKPSDPTCTSASAIAATTAPTATESVSVADAAAPAVTSAASTEPEPHADAAAPLPPSNDGGPAQLATEIPDAGRPVKPVKRAKLPPEVF